MKKNSREVLKYYEVWVRYREKVELCEEDARKAKTVARAARDVFDNYLAKMLEKDGHVGRGHLVTVRSASWYFLHHGFNLWLLISMSTISCSYKATTVLSCSVSILVSISAFHNVVRWHSMG